MGDLILKAPPEFEELPCRPPFRMIWFHNDLFPDNVHLALTKVGELPGTFEQLQLAEKERDKRLPIFPDITIVALGSAYRRCDRLLVPVWKPKQETPIEWVYNGGLKWPVGTRFILR